MEIAAISIVCLALGLVIGYGWGKGKKFNAPAPALPDYDADNPINARSEARTVVECGREWTVYGGR